MKTALVLKDKVSQKVFYVMLCESEETAKNNIDNNPRIEYSIIPNWEFVCEAVKQYNKETL